MPKLRKTLPKELTDFCYGHTSWMPEDIEQCKEMLAPCDSNARERGGYKETALHKQIPLEIVEWLVERGADVNAANTYGTPLFKHAAFGNYDICRFLIEHGADVNVTAHAGHTPLFSAVSLRKCNCDIVRLLLEHGADPCHHSEHWDGSKTPLLYMLSRGAEAGEVSVDAARLLIRAQKEKGGIPKDEWEKAQEYVSRMGHEFELYKNDMTGDFRRQREAVMKRYYAMFDVAPAKPVIKHDGTSPIKVDDTLTVWEQHSALWEFLVPSSGSCATVQGEVIRITGRVDDESNRNGGANWDKEYRKMLEALTTYFLHGNALSGEEMEDAGHAIHEIDRCRGACGCQKEIDQLAGLAVKWVSQNPEPVPLGKVPYNR